MGYSFSIEKFRQQLSALSQHEFANLFRKIRAANSRATFADAILHPVVLSKAEIENYAKVFVEFGISSVSPKSCTCEVINGAVITMMAEGTVRSI